MKKQNIIIDFEFNGLPRYNFTPEINQVKMKNLTNGKTVCQNFKTHNKGCGRAYYGLIKGDKMFSQKEFEKLLNTIGASDKDAFYGFSIKTDKELLSSYGIDLSTYVDIQEQLMLKKKFERPMAMGGRSLEFCYYLVTKEVVTVDHNSADELALIEKLFCATRGKKQKYLTVYPWGPEAGMPLDLYVDDNRRRADGYRYNNNDILAISLNHYIAEEEKRFFCEEEEQKEEVKYITLDEAEEILNKAVEEAEAAAAKSKEGVVRPLEEIKALLPRSSRNRVSGLALERALEEGIITPEEAKIISKDMEVF